MYLFTYFLQSCEENPSTFLKMYFLSVLKEILPKYQEKLVRYINFFWTTLFRTSLVGSFRRYNFPFWFMFKSTMWSHLKQSIPFSENVMWCYGRECRSLVVNVHIEEDLIVKSGAFPQLNSKPRRQGRLKYFILL